MTAVPAPASSAPSRISLRAFTRAYGEHKVIEDLTLEIEPGEFVALVGRSGCGKTTLLRALAGLDDVSGQDVQVPSSRAVVYQDARLLPWRRVWRNVALGLRGPIIAERAQGALREVGLAHRVDAWPLTLSGGEAQRVALARALVREPQLLLLDEPFAALDALTRIKMHELVLRLWQAHRPAVVLVTHDVDEAIALSSRVLLLDRGHIAAEERILPGIGRDPAALQAIKARLLARLGVLPSGPPLEASAPAAVDEAPASIGLAARLPFQPGMDPQA
jgi:sulfonate transport system ATP-binding protein